MPLDSYSNLKAEIIRFTGRNDVADIVDSVIDMAESRMYANDVEPLRLRSMETRSEASLDPASRFIALPDDFLKMRRLQLTSTPNYCDLKFRAPDQLVAQRTSGVPRFFTVTSQIELDRIPDSAYTVEIQYFARLASLSDIDTTNDILTNYPDIYLYGALWAVYDFAAEEDKSEYYYNKFIAGIVGANKQDRKGRYGSAPVMRTEGSTP